MSATNSPVADPGNFLVRLLLVAVYAVILFVVKFVLQAIVLVQLLAHLFVGSASIKAQKLGQTISEYIYKVWLYMTYNTNERPFPFRWRRRVQAED
jgi:hypothetical protein